MLWSRRTFQYCEGKRIIFLGMLAREKVGPVTVSWLIRTGETSRQALDAEVLVPRVRAPTAPRWPWWFGDCRGWREAYRMQLIGVYEHRCSQPRYGQMPSDLRISRSHAHRTLLWHRAFSEPTAVLQTCRVVWCWGPHVEKDGQTIREGTCLVQSRLRPSSKDEGT